MLVKKIGEEDLYVSEKISPAKQLVAFLISIALMLSLTTHAMATVRTTQAGGDIVVAVGWGAKDSLEKDKSLCR